MAKLTYEPVAFSWEPLARATTYLIQIFADGVTEPVASAYRIEPGYTLPEKIFLASFKPDNSYLWSVKGFDAEGYLVAQSPVLRFSFLQQSEYVPGQVIIFHASSTWPTNFNFRSWIDSRSPLSTSGQRFFIPAKRFLISQRSSGRKKMSF